MSDALRKMINQPYQPFSRQDIAPYIVEIEEPARRLARQAAREEDGRIEAVLRDAYERGYLAADNGADPDFDGWLADFIAKNQED